MFPFTVLIILTLVGFINGRVISYSSSGSGEDQYQRRVETGMLKQPLVETERPQSEFATDRTLEIESTTKMMRILTHKNQGETTTHSQDEDIQDSPSDDRPKRSYYPFASEYQLQWSRFEGTNTWNTNMYSVQRPILIPIATQNHYSYYDNVNLAPKGAGLSTKRAPSKTTRASRTLSPQPLMTSDHLGGDDGNDNPVWDITAYHSNTPKSSRHSRASKRELLFFEEALESKKPRPLSRDDSGDNDIRTGPLTISGLRGPSKCAWAIVSCCATSSVEINHGCFKELECPGPFWDVNPCSTKFTKAAIQNALYFYNSKS